MLVMSVVLLEGSHNRSSLYSEAQRRQLVAGFEAVVSNKLTVERNLASNPPKNGSYSELVGVSMVFIYDRDPRLQRGRVTIEPVIDSDLGYRFEPNGVQGVKRTLLDLTDRKNIEEIYSRMVSVDIADALVGLIRA